MPLSPVEPKEGSTFGNVVKESSLVKTSENARKLGLYREEPINELACWIFGVEIPSLIRNSQSEKRKRLIYTQGTELSTWKRTVGYEKQMFDSSGNQLCPELTIRAETCRNLFFSSHSLTKKMSPVFFDFDDIYSSGESFVLFPMFLQTRSWVELNAFA